MKTIRMICWVRALGFAAAMGLAGRPALGEEQPLKLDPSVEQPLRRLAATMQSARTVSCDVSLLRLTEAEGMKQEITTTFAFAAERPNRLALRHKAGMAGNTIVCDGKTLTVYVDLIKRYQELEAPADCESFFTAGGAAAGNMLFLENLMVKDVYAALLEGVTKAAYAGTEKVGGQECHHLKFVQDQFDWELWMTTGDKPVVTKVVTDMTKEFSSLADPMPGMKAMRLTVINTFANWTLNAELPAGTFLFSPPPDARKVDSLSKLATGDEEGDTDGPASIVGQKAPAFDLKLLTEGRLRIPEPAQTNKVIVLHFWATWCGPCARSLPVSDKLAAEYADKGVVVCAVNQQEQPDRIREYMEKVKVTLPVALDEEGKVGNLYRLRGMPQTVLIGKDGTVQSVHVGVLPDLESRLRADLEALVAGRKLPEGANTK